MRTGASGATTVVMSRPSTTMPGAASAAMIARNSSMRCVRTSGTRATRLTTAEIRGSRIASVTSVSPTCTAYPVGVGADAVVEAREARDDGCRVIGVDARRLGVPRERAIGGAGVEEPVAEPPRHLFRHARLAAARGSVDGDDEWDDG